MHTVRIEDFPVSAEILALLKEGETILLQGDDSTLAYLVPPTCPGGLRPSGLCAGEFAVPDDFNQPDPEVEAHFYGAQSEA